MHRLLLHSLLYIAKSAALNASMRLERRPTDSEKRIGGNVVSAM